MTIATGPHGRWPLDLLPSARRRERSLLCQATRFRERWAKTGMPVARKERLVTASASDLTQWLGREADEPVNLVAPEMDLSPDHRRQT